MHEKQQRGYDKFKMALDLLGEELQLPQQHILIGSCGYGYDTDESDLDIAMNCYSVCGAAAHPSSLQKLYTAITSTLERLAQIAEENNIARMEIKDAQLLDPDCGNRARFIIKMTDMDGGALCDVDLSISGGVTYWNELGHHDYRMQVLRKNPGVLEFLKVGRQNYGKIIDGYIVQDILQKMSLR